MSMKISLDRTFYLQVFLAHFKGSLKLSRYSYSKFLQIVIFNDIKGIYFPRPHLNPLDLYVYFDLLTFPSISSPKFPVLVFYLQRILFFFYWFDVLLTDWYDSWWKNSCIDDFETVNLIYFSLFYYTYL